MVLLLLFAALAGAATAITPCVLPVLPALLSAGGTGGRRRPFGVVTGLTITHVITIIGIASVVDKVGFADGALRTFAIVVLFLFGVVMFAPPIAHWLEARLAVLSRFGPRRAGEGFWSGLPVGGALGFVYAPCAGPVLAAVISVSASQGTSGKLIAVGIAYGLGSATVLLALTLGGRRLMDRVRAAGRGPVVQRTLGGVLIVTAILMFANLDVRAQTALANHFPGFITNPTKALEKSGAIEDRLADLRGKAKFDSRRAGAQRGRLPVLGRAPAFKDNQRWFNSKPLTLASLRGRVVLVDFWTYTCINCIRTLPYIRAWDQRYRKDGLTVVGMHTPEFAFEKKAGNVQAAIAQNHLHYPVAQDNDYGTWNAYGNNYWPAKYLIDATGKVRYTHFGEGDYATTEQAIRSLLQERNGHRALGAAARTTGPILVAGQTITPETYLGADHAQGQPQSWVTTPPTKGTRSFRATPAARVKASRFALGGRWTITGEAAVAHAGATLRARVVGSAVYLVLSSPGARPRTLQVRLDGRPIRAKDAGEDVHAGRVTVTRQRLYRLVDLESPGEHLLELGFQRAISGFAFTFG